MTYPQKLKKSEEDLLNEKAALEEEQRAADLVEYDIKDILGCVKRGGDLLWHVVWKGGKKTWGSRAMTWEPLDSDFVADFLGGAGKLKGRLLTVQWAPMQAVRAKITRWSKKMKKHFVKFVEEDAQDDGYLDLLNGEKTWRFE
jgi:hypothetical protein